MECIAPVSAGTLTAQPRALAMLPLDQARVNIEQYVRARVAAGPWAVDVTAGIPPVVPGLPDALWTVNWQ